MEAWYGYDISVTIRASHAAAAAVAAVTVAASKPAQQAINCRYGPVYYWGKSKIRKGRGEGEKKKHTKRHTRIVL